MADFVLPSAWHRHRIARRGSAGAQRFVPGPDARQAFDAAVRDRQAHVILAAPTTGESTRLAARAWLDRAADATPFGAAAAAAATTGGFNDRPRAVAIADTWVAERGVRFAAEAAVTLQAMLMTDDFHRYSGPDTRYGVRAMRPGESHHAWIIDIRTEVLLRVREAVATASEEDYTAVVAALAPHRATHPYASFAASVLVPARHEWVEADIASAIADNDEFRAAVLLTAAGTGAQASALAAVAHHYTVVSSMTVLTTLVDGVGVGAAPALFHWLDASAGSTDIRQRVLSILTVLPSEEVVRGLLERADGKHVTTALRKTAERHPEIALRVLAESDAAPDLLAEHVLTHTDLAERALPSLDPESAGRVERIIQQTASMTVAPGTALPPLLTDPPWLHRGKPVKPVVISGLACTDPVSVSWLPGERETWRTTPFPRYSEGVRDWPAIAASIAAGTARWFEGFEFFADAPEELARPLLAGWRSTETWQAEHWMRVLVARFELDALPHALPLAQRALPDYAALLMPYSSPEIAVLMAEWLARLKSLRRVAMTWLLRHPEAARALVAPALGKAGPARRQAEGALLTLHANGHSDAVRTAAASYGPDAAAAIETLLATDPLTVLPARMPPTPTWAIPAVLPPVRLRDGSGALPADAVGHVITILSISKLDEPYAGLAIVRDACEPSDLAEFAWAVFQRWQSSGGDAKENWALTALGLLGDDETVRRLTPLILAWPGEGGHAKAVTGVDILATIGTDVALMHLHSVAQRAKFKGLKSAAQQKITEVADALGLTADQLADRLVPDFGLAADGSLRLDYGPRQFVVGFDEQLRPFVTDSAGKRLKALPKPGARDDAELATAAWKQFAALKKDVRTVAADQVRRLERAMVTGRRWTGTEFRQLFVAHPLLWHLVRRLVWADHSSGAAFRVAEDRSFSTVDDDAFTLPDDALVGVAHPVHLGTAVPAWAELFADYEILQPFPQLSRPVLTLTPDEREATHLARFENITLPTTRVIGLERFGWQREAPQDAGMQDRMELHLSPELEVAIELDPGIAIGDLTTFPDQKLTEIYLHDGTGSKWGPAGKGRIPFGRLDPVTASELLRNLTDLTSP
ncbi:DUF4132 domain-containing protein [Actinoplanes sp. NPDC051861]|uniref:DUF4132 domain-containing protein n=1 Tax=Actinoplanes sp. NPDC051861 TaxID=3155170 RepID=UPI003419C616